MGARAAQAGGADDSRLRRLDPVRQGPGRRQGAVPRAVRPDPAPVPEDHQGADRRPYAPGPPDHRDQGHAQRGQEQGRVTPVGAVQRAAARSRVAGRRDLPPHARLLRQQLRRQRPRHAPGRHRASCGSCASRTRTATSTRSRPATACGARTWPTTTTTASSASRTTASTRTATTRTNWGLDEEGASNDPTSETYRGAGPDSEPETKAMKKLWKIAEPDVHQERPHGGRAAAVAAGLPEVHADPGQRDLRGAGRHAITHSAIQDDEESFDPDLSSELYITNGDELDDAYHHGILGFTPEGTQLARPGRDRVRVRGRRGGGPGGVPAPPEVLDRPRGVRRPSRRTRSRTSATRPATGTSTRSPSRSAIRRPCRSPPSARSATSSSTTASTAAASRRRRRRSSRAASGTARTRASTTTACAGWSRAPSPATT